MENTKEQILRVALSLFSRRGYEAVSVSDIAGELGITKGALYRHYESKQAIFDAILRRMEERDTELAEADHVPLAGEESRASLENIIAFSKTMLRYWTEDAFARDFRRMLTIEQYRSRELTALYHQYLGSGPVEYVSMMLRELGMERAEETARLICGVMHIGYAAYDGSEQPERELKITEMILEQFLIADCKSHG